MAVTDYTERKHGDPDVEVRLTYQGRVCVGFIDARRRRDGAWEAWVRFTVPGVFPESRVGWFGYEELELLDQGRQDSS